jgi:ABC-type transporter Mla MlaB component
MTTANRLLEIDGQHLVQSLQQVGAELDSAQGAVTLNFSSVYRIDSGALTALGRLAGIAEEKAVKVALRSVNVDIYKVLKLARVSTRFAFVS